MSTDAPDTDAAPQAAHLADDLAGILTAARQRSGDTLAQVAERAGVHRNSFRELEEGHRGDGRPVNPTLDRIARAADAYGVELTIVKRKGRR